MFNLQNLIRTHEVMYNVQNLPTIGKIKYYFISEGLNQIKLFCFPKSGLGYTAFFDIKNILVIE